MNYTVFQWINGWAGHAASLDTTMVFITNSAPVVAVVFMLLLWFSKASRSSAIAKQYTVLYTVISMMLALVINVALHHLYYHARPFVTHHVHQLVSHSKDSSFVSDHGVLVFTIAFMLLLRKDAWGYAALIWAVLVGISRMYVGVHYPADILGAAVLSWGTGAIVLLSAGRIEPVAQVIFRVYNGIAKRIPALSKYNHTT
ncbi:undecaprenyl-diphosphatase [Ectobacillus ponti]|uniref:Undecaprenyl-diphosphatase n=1 Tax=Ectobacillus ponti TaxID=2961894 RepID=A0AA42BSF6_9BACI|nr:undecaprenyl-diphosphatase [Ectobacillus ponti]MCP8971336.1 undecaprenyl-diphosphatase [Ectobacillus ponti]